MTAWQVNKRAVHSQISLGEASALVVTWMYKRIQFIVILVSGQMLLDVELLWSLAPESSSAPDSESENGEQLHIPVICVWHEEVKLSEASCPLTWGRRSWGQMYIVYGWEKSIQM